MRFGLEIRRSWRQLCKGNFIMKIKGHCGKVFYELNSLGVFFAICTGME